MNHNPNRLVNETSPYLLQHAHNPVDWYPWGNEALNRAREEDKPILVSIGYAACHWCHVMEKESFEDEDTAALMNKYFINIKIDREERPDLDHIYMDAVQAMTGSGGWPLNVFLTPEARPFYGGTYFPPRPAYNRPSWKQVLENIQEAYYKRRHEVNAQAENLTEHLLQSNAFGLQKEKESDLFSPGNIEEAAAAILKSADKEWGGFGRAPKFPQTGTIRFLLRHYYTTQNEESLAQALLSLDKMIAGGIYDQAGGGFARYSTDTEWLVPHFEKMLYDNALLLDVIAEAYQLTGKERYREVIEETMQFVRRELMTGEEAFLSALDADSEGVEGKFYVWNADEVKELLKEEASVVCAYYDITEKGNWEGVNILRVKKEPEELAGDLKMPVGELLAVISKAKKRLLEARGGRMRPGTDDKTILGWNALMNSACSKVYAATGNDEYKELAVRNMHFLLNVFSTTDRSLMHTWKGGKTKYPAFLDDYAFLIRALIDLQEITGEIGWLEKALQLTVQVKSNFSDTETPFFYYTHQGQEDVIVRKKEVYDGATPSGNAVMAVNLFHLSILADNGGWRQQSMDMVSCLGKAIVRYPTSFACWLSLLQEIAAGTNEIVIAGEGARGMIKELVRQYLPHRVIITAETAVKGFPLVDNKPLQGPPQLYLCRDYTCQQPVFSVNGLTALINKAYQPE